MAQCKPIPHQPRLLCVYSSIHIHRGVIQKLLDRAATFPPYQVNRELPRDIRAKKKRNSKYRNASDILERANNFKKLKIKLLF